MDPHSPKPCCSRVSCLYFKLWGNIPENAHTTVPLATTQRVDGGHCQWRGHRIAYRPSLRRCSSCREEATQRIVWTTSWRRVTFPRTAPSKPAAVSHRQRPSPRHVVNVRAEPKCVLCFIVTSKRNQGETFFPVKFNFTSVGQTKTWPLIVAVPKLLSLYCRAHVHTCTVTGGTRVPVSGVTCEHITDPRGLNGLIHCEGCFPGTDLTL